MKEFDKGYKNNGFRVPDKYFENMETQLSERLYPSTQKWKVYIGKAIRIAASVVVIISIGTLSFKSSQKQDTPISFSDLDSMEVVNYTSSIDITDDELEELVSEQAIDSIYKAEIQLEQVNNVLPAEDISDLEEEYDFLDIDNDI
jgi:hypothetical protein